MNKSLDRSAGMEVATDPPSTESPGTEAPATEAPIEMSELVTDAPGTDAPGTESPGTEAPLTEAPDEKDQVIAELRAKLAEKESPKTSAPSTDAPIEVGEHNFLEDVDFDDVTQTPEEFNKLLNKIYKQAVSDTQKAMSEKFNSSIPDMIRTNINTVTKLQKARDEFYEQNKDLLQFQKVVGTVFEELATKEPNKTYEEIMKDVAPEARKRLGLKNNPKPETKEDTKPPRLPKKKSKPGKSKESTETDPLQGELEEMNKTLGR